MKKWMKLMSAMLMMCMVFVLSGNAVQADTEDDNKIRSVTVEYEGDPVPYGETIDKNDFTVKVRLKSGERTEWTDFEISPDTMKSESRQKVTITIDEAHMLNGRDYKTAVYVKCKEPELESIEARYDGDDIIEGGEIDRDDVTVTAYYSDGSDKKVTGWKFERYKLTEGTNYITITYEEDDIEEEDEIRVEAFQGKLEYISAYYNGGAVVVGNKVNTANIKVTGVYDADRYGRVSSVITGWYLQNYSIQEGNNTLTVTYKQDGKTYEDTINVVGKRQASTTTTTTTAAPTTGSKDGRWEQTAYGWKWRLNTGGYLTNSWMMIDSKWYFFDGGANMVNSTWKMIDSKWYYFNPNGDASTGWKVINGKYYFFHEQNGDMFTGWKLWNGKYYYLVPGSGEMATSRWIGNYYVDGAGVWTQTR